MFRSSNSKFQDFIKYSEVPRENKISFTLYPTNSLTKDYKVH